jgi:hypothetical protein
MLKRTALAVGLAATIAGTTGTAGATQISSGMRWPRATLTAPATVTIHPDVHLSAAWLSFVKGAAAAWNAGQTNLVISVGSTATCSDAYPGPGICAWEVYRPDVWWWGWAAQGGYSYGGVTEIVLATLKLNDAYVNPSDPAQAPNARYITCHELGEDIGLHDHSDTSDPASSYDPTCLTNDPSRVADHPSAEDYAVLQQLYSTVFPIPAPAPKPCRKKNC